LPQLSALVLVESMASLGRSWRISVRGVLSGRRLARPLIGSSARIAADAYVLDGVEFAAHPPRADFDGPAIGPFDLRKRSRSRQTSAPWWKTSTLM